MQLEILADVGRVQAVGTLIGVADLQIPFFFFYPVYNLSQKVSLQIFKVTLQLLNYIVDRLIRLRSPKPEHLLSQEQSLLQYFILRVDGFRLVELSCVLVTQSIFMALLTILLRKVILQQLDQAQTEPRIVTTRLLESTTAMSIPLMGAIPIIIQ